MKRFVSSLALAMCLPLVAHADEASQRAKAKELVGLLHTERMIQQLSDGMVKRVDDVAQRSVDANPTPENKEKLADFEKKSASMIQSTIGWSAVESTFIDVYAKTFTEQELDAIIAFFKSSAGASFLEKTPEVNSQINQLTQSKMSTLQSQLNQAMQDFRKSLTAAATPAPGTN